MWDTPVLVNLHVYVVVFILGQRRHPVWWHVVAADGEMGAVRRANSARCLCTGGASLQSLGGQVGAVPGTAVSAPHRGGASVATPTGGATDRRGEILSRARLHAGDFPPRVAAALCMPPPIRGGF